MYFKHNLAWLIRVLKHLESGTTSFDPQRCVMRFCNLQPGTDWFCVGLGLVQSPFLSPCQAGLFKVAETAPSKYSQGLLCSLTSCIAESMKVDSFLWVNYCRQLLWLPCDGFHSLIQFRIWLEHHTKAYPKSCA